MNIREIITILVDMGYRLEPDGENIRYKYMGPGEPDAEAESLLVSMKAQKPTVLDYLRAKEDPSLCTSCPWCMPNPWTFFPDLPLWCGWSWNHLATNNGQCRDRRVGRVPDPKLGGIKNPGPERSNLNPPDLNPKISCFECYFFDPADFSPNPTQAWGFCRNMKKGRYGIARACELFADRRMVNGP